MNFVFYVGKNYLLGCGFFPIRREIIMFIFWEKKKKKSKKSKVK